MYTRRWHNQVQTTKRSQKKAFHSLIAIQQADVGYNCKSPIHMMTARGVAFAGATHRLGSYQGRSILEYKTGSCWLEGFEERAAIVNSDGWRGGRGRQWFGGNALIATTNPPRSGGGGCSIRIEHQMARVKLWGSSVVKSIHGSPPCYSVVTKSWNRL